ncbi:hypothetical protein GCM10017783_14260 [Deinococcus piscis]|uniref:Branched-chain amino acid transport n=1 Tax=Deinococcus piscis TaxID=394230 RepID=A0ABQ3K5F8_9DEIO|nr:AzlD domain-containing protein [Deinococcus piscis]GHG03107.1 hypothetical protein GCM10017783_14260 [Deinococcus piscis]
MSALAVILLMWLVTYLPRWLGLNLGHLQLPAFWQAFLRFVPVSVFPALLVPDVLGSPEWPQRLMGCVVAVALLLRTRQLALGILGGFAAYWLARVLSG